MLAELYVKIIALCIVVYIDDDKTAQLDEIFYFDKEYFIKGEITNINEFKGLTNFDPDELNDILMEVYLLHTGKD